MDCVPASASALWSEWRRAIKHVRVNLREQHTAIAQRLRQIMPQDSMIVVAPDHPLLLRSPDLLIAEKGKLLAIMCGSASETRRPRLAWARLALARAALPPEAVFGFVTVPSTEELGQGLAGDVDVVVRLREVSELAKVSPDKVGSGRTEERVEARSRTMVRFGAAYRVSQELARLRGGSNEPTLTRPRSGRRVQYEVVPQEVIKAELHGEVVAADMVSLAFDGAARSFDFHDGVAWPSGEGGIAYLPNFPESRGDPERYARANAFAGWVLSPASLAFQHKRLSYLLRNAGEAR